METKILWSNAVPYDLDDIDEMKLFNPQMIWIKIGRMSSNCRNSFWHSLSSFYLLLYPFCCLLINGLFWWDYGWKGLGLKLERYRVKKGSVFFVITGYFGIFFFLYSTIQFVSFWKVFFLKRKRINVVLNPYSLLDPNFQILPFIQWLTKLYIFILCTSWDIFWGSIVSSLYCTILFSI